MNVALIRSFIYYI